MTPPPVRRIVVVGRDAALWLAVNVLRSALAPADVSVSAVELPSRLAAADLYATHPPLEALHTQLRIDECTLLKAVGGAFTLGQNFRDSAGASTPFLHGYGGHGSAISGQDFFACWLKARRFGLPVQLEDFSLPAVAARQGRLLIPDDETERYGRSDYGYHLPAAAYVRSLRRMAEGDGVSIHAADQCEVLSDAAGIKGLHVGSERIVGDLYIDATDEGLLIGHSGGGRESWSDDFPADRVLVARGTPIAPIPTYAEIRAGAKGWKGLYPAQRHTYVLHAYQGDRCSDDQAACDAADASRITLDQIVTRRLKPGCVRQPWTGNCVAIGRSAASFDPIHNVDLLAVQLGLVRLLALYPAGIDMAAERTEYNRLMSASFARIRDFQLLHYRINSYGAAPFWVQARTGPVPDMLAHTIALFRARGEIAPYEEESFAPDSWRAMFIGHGVIPDSYLPTVDSIAPDHMKAQFRTMLGFVKEQVLRQPTHDAYLAIAARPTHG